MSLPLRSIIFAALVATPAGAQTPSLQVPANRELIRGMPSGVRITSLGGGDSATIEAFRRVVVRSAARQDTVSLRTAATFRGVHGASVAIDSLAPTSGNWDRVDPFALFWSMERRDTALALPPGRIYMQLVWHGRVVDSASMAIRAVPTGVAARWMAGDGFAGALAMPSSPGIHPALLLLHGSEGGDTASAKALAESFAAQGYAAFAMTYFAFANRVPGIPTALVNIPIEMADRARNWLGGQPGIDTSRTAIWGGSKGAEFALVVASRRSWPRAVVACVPSDVVWSGFGRAAEAGERYSSWSDGGAGLPYIPYDRYDEALAGKVTARAVHERSRTFFADSVAPARIDIARSRAQFLLLGGERDEVWPSGEMARALAAAGGGRVSLVSYPMAGHGICGVGANMAMQYERAYPTDTPPDARATAAAGADAWRRTVEFLSRVLRR